MSANEIRLSALVGAPVVDASGRTLGRTADLVVTATPRQPGMPALPPWKVVGVRTGSVLVRLGIARGTFVAATGIDITDEAHPRLIIDPETA
jgi:hypothetical protein